MRPLLHFTYHTIYTDLPAAEQWYAWVADVQNYIAQQYGVEGQTTRNPDRRVTPMLLSPWDEQEQAIIAAAFTVWYRSERLKHERWCDTPHGYQWMRDACEQLSAAIQGVPHESRDYKAEWLAQHPEYVQREAEKAARAEQQRAEQEGRLF